MMRLINYKFQTHALLMCLSDQVINTVFNLAVYRIGNTYNAKNELYLIHVYY